MTWFPVSGKKQEKFKGLFKKKPQASDISNEQFSWNGWIFTLKIREWEEREKERYEIQAFS